jgi:hypothetical protein
MNSDTQFRRIASIAAIVAAPVALGASWYLLHALGYDPDIISDPSQLILIGPPMDAALQRVGFIGMFGYSLLLLPLAVYLWLWLKPANEAWLRLYSLCGIGHILVNALGSAILFSISPSLISAYGEASAAQGETLVVVFQSVMNFAMLGLFPLSYLLGAMWWIGIGRVLLPQRRVLGLFTILMGIGMLVYGAGAALQIGALAALEIVTFVTPIWGLWIGIVILRSAEPQAEAESGQVASYA